MVGYFITLKQIMFFDYIFLFLVVALIAFIFIRRLVIWPFQYWSKIRRKLYTRLLIDILKNRKINKRFDDKRFLYVKNWMDRVSLEEILLARISEKRNKYFSKILTGVYEDLGLVDWRVKKLQSRIVWTRRISADALGKSMSQKAVKPLTAIALLDRDADVRFIAAKALGKLKDITSIDYVINLLKDFPNERCIIIADILVDFDRVALPYLLKAMNSSHGKVRFWCTRALAEINIPNTDLNYKSIEAGLEKQLLVTNDDELRAYSILTLGRMRSRKNTLMIKALMKRDTSSFVRSSAAQALGILNDPASVDGLIEACNDPAWEVNHSAAWALTQLAHDAGEAARQKLGALDGLARERCKELLGDLGKNDLAT